MVLGCVQLLQSLSQHRQHLKDLPTQTMTDILNEVTAAAQSHRWLLRGLDLIFDFGYTKELLVLKPLFDLPIFSSCRFAFSVLQTHRPSDPRGGV